ncbi:XRE family transcriptional regulator [Clostridium oceanicum]|uniref:HTH cro/C1-type domain-containing protein n=1 Tax=Clostridium oceanicum TaxID=1543 RepID=A0ABP3USE2_9CLOT
MEKLFNDLPWYTKIHVLRVIKGWNQTEAASKCLTNQKGYWLWENGRNYPRLLSRKSIAKAYGLEIEDIFSNCDCVVA